MSGAGDPIRKKPGGIGQESVTDHDATVTKEKICKDYAGNYIVHIGDIIQLTESVANFCAEHQIGECSYSFHVLHIDGKEEVFNSVQHLKAYDSNNKVPVENITIKHSIQMAENKNAVVFGFNCNIQSRTALRTKFFEDEQLYPDAGRFAPFHRQTGYAAIEYTDRSFAESLLSVISDWYNSLEGPSENKFRIFIKQKADTIARILPAIFISLLVISIYIKYDNFVRLFHDLWFLTVTWILYALSVSLGITMKGFRNDIKRMQAVSAICMNAGDRKSKQEFEKCITVNFGKAVESIVIAVFSIAAAALVIVFFV